MTYNTHYCIGADGHAAPERIARIIARYDPDIVGLQELDVGRRRSGSIDQAKRIARALDMSVHYHPSYVLKEASFGNAVLSRFPVEAVYAGILPGRQKSEPRAVLWTKISAGSADIDFITTHLSYYPAERTRQVQALLGPSWLGNSKCGDSVVLCGDFNMTPRSRAYRALARTLRDAHLYNGKSSGERTWMGLACLDYIFVGPAIKLDSVFIPRNYFTRKASDHYPVIGDITME